MYSETFVYTPGVPFSPQRLAPNETIPFRYIGSSSPCLEIRGPPLSPVHESFPIDIYKAQ